MGARWSPSCDVLRLGKVMAEHEKRCKALACIPFTLNLNPKHGDAACTAAAASKQPKVWGTLLS